MSASNHVACVNPDELAQLVRSRNYVVLDCWAPWCAPCHMLGAMLRDLAPKYRLSLSLQTALNRSGL
ncbi:MAG: thioredoxin family protein [Conexivisphaera sp.]